MNPLLRIYNRIRFKRMVKKDASRNVVDGMVKARALYRKLSVLAHPDKNPDRIEIAEDIMQRVAANRYNYEELLRLHQEIIEKLEV